MISRALRILGFFSLTLTSLLISKESDFITYEWLIDCAQNTAYTDHIPHFRRLFNTIPVRGLLECGCGFSSKYFMDHCDQVVSVEFMDEGTSDHWYRECLKLYQDCPNWIPMTYNADLQNVSFNRACAYACAVHKDYALIDSSYLDSLDGFFKDQIQIAHREGMDIDVAFVDAGVYTRGDMVKMLLANAVPIVVAHDTGCDYGSDVNEGHYAWFVVKTPPDYEKIYIPFGMGTTFWISKKLPYVIASMTSYRDEIIQSEATLDTITSIADSICITPESFSQVMAQVEAVEDEVYWETPLFLDRLKEEKIANRTQYVYHNRRPNFKGDLIIPLNRMPEFGEEFQELYEMARAKYQGREYVLDKKVPPLDCLWNDVIFLSPAHPHLHYLAYKEAGYELRNVQHFQIPVEVLKEKNVTLWKWLCETKYPRNDPLREITDPCREMDLAHYQEMEDLPLDTKEFYRQVFDPEHPEKYPRYHWYRIHHILCKDIIDTSDPRIKIINWEDPIEQE